jgi:hypothetical protein
LSRHLSATVSMGFLRVAIAHYNGNDFAPF